MKSVSVWEVGCYKLERLLSESTFSATISSPGIYFILFLFYFLPAPFKNEGGPLPEFPDWKWIAQNGEREPQLALAIHVLSCLWRKILKLDQGVGN